MKNNDSIFFLGITYLYWFLSDIESYRKRERERDKMWIEIRKVKRDRKNNNRRSIRNKNV